jgi:hypothetical protein
MGGIVHAGDQLYLGPDGNGAFQMVTVKSIQRKRLNVPLACAGQSASFGLKKIRRSVIRKGMVMLDKETTPPPRGCREFEAEILVLYHSTTIGHKYQAMLHCGAVRQTARVLAMDKPDQILRTGDRATVRFQFLQPAYLKVGARLVSSSPCSNTTCYVVLSISLVYSNQQKCPPSWLDFPRGTDERNWKGVPDHCVTDSFMYVSSQCKKKVLPDFGGESGVGRVALRAFRVWDCSRLRGVVRATPCASVQSFKGEQACKVTIFHLFTHRSTEVSTTTPITMVLTLLACSRTTSLPAALLRLPG